jgi:hypothetical protein
MWSEINFEQDLFWLRFLHTYSACLVHYKLETELHIFTRANADQARST